MNVELPNGTVIEGVPEGTTKDQIMQKAISAGLATAEDFGVQETQLEQAAQPKEPTQTPEQESLARDAYNTLAEFASSTNRSILGALDFLTVDNVNAGLNLAGSDARVPTLTETLGNEGGFMEEGTARDVVRGVGGLVPAVAGAVPAVGRNVATARGAAKEILGLGAAKTSEVAAPVTKLAKNTAAAISDQVPSKAKEAAKLPLLRQSGDITAAGFKLDDAGRVVNDAVQKKALKAGIDEGAVAMIASANKATKSRLKDMVDVLEKGKGNLEFRNFNPPQRVVGEAIKDRLSIIQSANKEAANNLDRVANNLRGKPIDVSSPINQFLEDLAGERITFENGKLNFKGSSIEGLGKAQGVIRRVFHRLHKTDDPRQSALRVHDAKKFIDEQVSYGKAPSGLSGRMEGIIKGLRHNLDATLDSQFPEYDKVNTMYSETRSVIDELQSLAGKKVDLTGVNVDKALGVMSRKVLSNYNTGTATEDLFSNLDSVASRYSTPLSGGLDDELLKIVSTEAELRRMFPTATKPNTLQGNMGMEMARGAADVATGGKEGLITKTLNKASEKIFSKSDEERIQALKDLLSE